MKTRKQEAKQTRVARMAASHKVAANVARMANNAKMAASHGPNAKFPFGIKIVAADGAETYERFKKMAERDARLGSLPGTGVPVNFEATILAARGEKYEGEVEPELGNPQGITLVSGVTGKTIAKTTGKKGAKTAAKSTKVEATSTPVVAKKGKKTARVEDGQLRIRLYAKGQFYFGKEVADRLADATHMFVEVAGKKVTMTPTKSENGSYPMHTGNGTLSIAPLLKDTGWSKKTQDLTAEPVGTRGFMVVVK
jgi:hypothetical protein